MIKTLKYFAIICISGLLMSCAGRDAEVKDMSPEEVAKSFIQAVAGGMFDEAWMMCDTVAMKDYIDMQKKAWAEVEKKDSNAFSIASKMLSEAGITIDDTIKEDGRRHVFCSIGLDDNTKGKLVILQKEEGEWKVTAIADRP